MPYDTPAPDAVEYRVNAAVGNDELNILFAAAWPEHRHRDFAPVLARSLGWVCAYLDGRLVGFVYLAWDGDRHAFLLDPSVHPDVQRRGIGRALVACAVAQARQRGVQWLHVDFASELRHFYQRCGFQPTYAGLMPLVAADTT